jgi:uncharacterized membrane protein YeiH
VALDGETVGVSAGAVVTIIEHLAMVTALGGGVARDVIIGDAPPAAFTNVIYLVLPIAAAAVTFVAHPLVSAGVHGARLRRRRTRAVLCHRHAEGTRLPPRCRAGGAAGSHHRAAGAAGAVIADRAGD